MRYLLSLILCLLAGNVWAYPPSFIGAVTQAPPVGGGSTYLLSEDFDGAAACGDGVDSNCSGAWTQIGTESPIDFNYATSPAPLAGTYSAYRTGSSDTPSGWYRSFTAQDTVYFYLILHVATRALGDIVVIRDGSGNTVMRVVDAGPEIGIFCNDNLDYDATIVDGTTYHLWGEYTKGTGSDATCSLSHASSATKPGSPQMSATGNSTGQAAQIVLNKNGNTQSFIFDKIRVSTSSIGSSPE